MKRFVIVLLILVLLLSISSFTLVNAAGKIKLTWLGWFPTQNDFAVIKKGFEAENPNIGLDAVCTGTYDPYVAKIKTDLAAGTGPDILSMQTGALVNQLKPYLLNLKPYLGTWIKQIVPSGMKEGITDGKQLMLPLGYSAQMYIYYNQTLFHEAGVKVPTTYAELVQVTKTLKAKFPNMIPFTWGLKDQWFATDTFMVLANQVSPGITTKADEGKVKWNSAPFLQAMKNFQQMVTDGIVPKEAVGVAEYEDAIGLFLDRKTPMFTNGSWNCGNLGLKYGDRRRGRATDNDIMGTFPFPNVNGGKPIVIGGIDIGVSINKDSKHIKEAMLMLKYMTVGEGQKYFTGNPQAGLIPVLIGMQKDMSNYTDDVAKASIKMFSDTFAQNLVAARQVSNTEVKNQIAVALQNILTGQQDPQKALDEVEKIAERQ